MIGLQRASHQAAALAVRRAAGFAALLVALAVPALASGQDVAGPLAITRRMAPVGPSQPRFEPGRLLVKLRSGTPDAVLSPPPVILGHLATLDAWLVSVPAGREMALARAWSALPGVEYAEPDWIRHAMDVSPNDPRYASDQWYLPWIGAPVAWAISTGSRAVIIAIIDTGVDTGHPDLIAKLLPGASFGDSNPSWDDTDGHGTHIAGIAAAATNNGIGVAGTDWGARILPVRVLTQAGSGGDDAISSGILWAVANGARIINLSLGAPGYGATLGSAVKQAYDDGALVVAAAGNDFLAGDPVEYPGAYPQAMAVGATDDQDNRASYSETGAYLSVAAPGGDPTDCLDPEVRHWITSTYPTMMGSYAQLAGTSQAAAVVSGLAGLVWSEAPGLTNDQVRRIIEGTAVLPAGTATDGLGHGRIDMASALRKAQSLVFLPGDLNGDGRVTLADAQLALRLAVGLDAPTLAQLQAAGESPTSGGGRVTLADVTRILRWVVGLDPLPQSRLVG